MMGIYIHVVITNTPGSWKAMWYFTSKKVEKEKKENEQKNKKYKKRNLAILGQEKKHKQKERE